MSDQINYVWEECSDAEKQKYRDDFNAHRKEVTNDGDILRETFTIKAYDNEKFVGVVSGKLSHGALHTSVLIIDKLYRGKGIATSLLKQAEDFAIKNNCALAIVETFNYQAPDFYQSHGYKIDFIRHGYPNNKSFYYFSKELNQ